MCGCLPSYTVGTGAVCSPARGLDGSVDQYRSLQRCPRCARYGSHRRPAGPSLRRQSRARLSGGRRVTWPPGTGLSHRPFSISVTVVDAKNVAGIAELGVVFLLFLIGMELSYERLKTMRRMVFGLGGLQIALSTAVIAGFAGLAGNTPAVSIILGACLALSSTAIVVSSPTRAASRALRAAPASPSSWRRTSRSFQSCSSSQLWVPARAAPS